MYNLGFTEYDGIILVDWMCRYDAQKFWFQTINIYIDGFPTQLSIWNFNIFLL